VGIREGLPARTETPLVGRDNELSALSEVFEGLLEGRGAIVSITGEPGIGKSRLVGEVQQRFAGRVRFLTGHAVAYAEALAYWPVRELLRNWLDLGVSDSEARIRLELRAELARSLAVDADEAYPFLAGVLGLVLEQKHEQRLRDLASEPVQHQTFDWMYQLVCVLARERPLCLVLEDVHWSDEATLSLLDELLPAAEQEAIGFMLIHRSDPDHPAWQLIDRARRRFRGSFLELELEPLTAGETQAPAEAEAGAELAEEAAHALADEREGIRTSSERPFETCASAASSSGRTARSRSSARPRSRPLSRRRSRRASTGSMPTRANSSRPPRW
jgi:predicted ATPase